MKVVYGPNELLSVKLLALRDAAQQLVGPERWGVFRIKLGAAKLG
jgi:hypothetical protein